MWEDSGAVQRTEVATAELAEHPIVPRDLRFDFDPTRAASWHAMGAHVAHWYNALSLFLPGGEAFFIDSVRRFEPRIGTPALRADVAGFIGQEAIHAREHGRYNRMLDEAGYPARYLAKRVQNLANWCGAHLPVRTQLAGTVACEHLTTLLAHTTLADQRMFAGCDAEATALWSWHAVEESEHRAVAFDVYREVTAGSPWAYPRRAGAMIVLLPAFAAGVLAFTLILVWRDRRVTDLRGWGTLWRCLFDRPGQLRGVGRGVIDFLRPSFHPIREP
jgi:hypothetical protein